ncbi:MAG: AEC family transporter [Clostridia bacterium]|nr:AEC family transporter [Clostridia bacterium]MBQ8925044.1 AEC family transporter [Clostridia bacterium]
MTYFLIVIRQIAQFILFAGIGVLAAKTKIITRETIGVLSKLVVRIALPFYIFTNTINGATRGDLLESWVVILLTVLLYVVAYVTAAGLAKSFRLEGNRKQVFKACTMFGNIGFMGIPIVASLFPDTAMLYVALFTIPDQLILWTVGVILTSPVEGKHALTLNAKTVGKKMLNPMNFAILLAVLLVLLDAKLPDLLNTSFTRIGQMATPLAMIYLGAMFCFIDIPQYLRRPEFYVEAVVKMLAVPVLFYLLLRALPGIREDIAVTLSVILAMPTMTTITMQAEIQHSDADYSSGMVFMTTLLSVLTIPMVCLIIGHL